MVSRDIILRRRAAFVAAALSSVATATSTRAEPDPEPEPVLDGPDPEAAVAHAEALSARGRLEEALAALAKIEAPHRATLVLRGRLLQRLRRYAAARTVFTRALPLLTSPDERLLVERDLADLAQRTAELDLILHPAHGTEIFVDDALIGVSPLPTPLFVEPGAHVITARHPGHPPATHTIDVAGGTKLALDLTIIVAVAPYPAVCLSPPPPPWERERSGVHLGLGLAPQFLLNVARDHGAPLFGAAVTAFVAADVGPFTSTVGPVGAIYASARDVGGLWGVRMGLEARPLPVLGIGVGAAAGYLHLSDVSEPAELDGLPGPRTVTSFFVMPEATVALAFGPLELGPAVGVMLSRSELGSEGTFGATYVSTTMWLRYTHRPSD